MSISDDSGSNPIIATLTAANGTVHFGSTTGLTIESGANNSITVGYSGTLEDINTALATLRFDPDLNYNGDASLTIHTDDQGYTGGGSLQDQEIISFNVIAVNDAPVLVIPQSEQAFTEDTAGTISGISVDDVEAASLQVSLAANHGTITLNALSGITFEDETADGAHSMVISGLSADLSAALDGLAYTPDANYNGADNLSIQVYDNGVSGDGDANTTSGAIAISVSAVNDAPVNVVPGAQTTDEETPLAISGVSVSDVDATALQIQLSVSHGSLHLDATETLFEEGSSNDSASMTLQGSIADLNNALAGLTYTPTSNYNGSDTFTLTTSDMGATGAGGIKIDKSLMGITVTPINDAPVISAPATAATNEDHAITFSGAAIQVVDVDADPDAVQVTLTAADGALTLSQITGLSFTTGDGNSDASMVFSGTQAAVNAALNGLVYTPTHDFNGATGLDITVNDLDHNGNGGPQSATGIISIDVASINDVPTFSIGTDQSVNEDATLQTISGWATAISAGAANESGQALNFTITDNNDPTLFQTGPTISSDGTLVFKPAADANGTATIKVTLHDDGGTAHEGDVDTSIEQTFTITVNAVNDTPFFTPGAATVTVDEDSAAYSAEWATAISAGAGNENGQTLTFNVSNDNHALFSTQPTIVIDPETKNGVLSFTPATDANGSATVTVSLSDNGGGADTSADTTITITVSPINDAPSFTTGGSVTVNEDSGAYSDDWASAISAGPANENSQTLTFQITANDNAALFSVQPSIAPDGALSFTLLPDVNGDAHLTVVLKDNGGTAAGGADTSDPAVNFTISVTAVNDTPAFAKGADVTVPEDDGPQTISGWATGISAGPSDKSGQTLTFTVTGNTNSGLFSAGPAISSDGTLTFTPAVDANGSATISITLSDNGGGANTSTGQSFDINVTAVNDTPTLTQPVGVDILEDDPQQTVNLSGIGSGAANETQTLTVTAVSDNTDLVPNPTVTYNSPDTTGSLAFTPVAGANGVANITVRVTDDGSPLEYVEKTFEVTVSAVNDAPSNHLPSSQTLLEDHDLTFSSANENPISVSNSDAGSDAIRASLTVSYGVLSLTTTPEDLTVSGEGTNSLVLTGSQADINTALDGLVYHPVSDNVAANSLQLVSDDQGHNGSGGALSDTDSVAINFTPVNDAPSFTKGSDETVLEDAGAQTFSHWASSFNKGPEDEDSQTLSILVTTDNDALFLVKPAISLASGDLTFTPAVNANGTAHVTVTLSDDGGVTNGGVDTYTTTFTISVTAINDAPSFTKGADQSAGEDAGAQTVNGWATDMQRGGGSDESSQALHFSTSVSGSLTFSVQPALAGNGDLTYTPAPNANGIATVTVTLSDDGGTANGGVDTYSDTFTISVSAVNDTPSFTRGANQTVNEDAGAQTVANWATDISSGPSDESTQTVNFLVNNDNNSLFSVQPAVASNGTLTYTPTANAYGLATVTVTIHDDGGGTDTSAAQTFTITVNSVNDVPSFTKGTDQTVNEDAGAQTVANWATDISSGPADKSSQTVTFQVTNGNNPLFSVQPAISPSGTLTYTPAANANGSATVSVTIKDNGGISNGGVDTSAVQTFTITVTAVNDAPVNQVPGAQATNEDQALVLSGATRITIVDDAGTNPIQVSLSATHGILTLGSLANLTNVSGSNGSASMTYTGKLSDFNAALASLTFMPAANYAGSAQITILTNDQGATGIGGAKSDTDTITIAVNAVNDAPVNTVPSAQVTNEDTLLTINGLSLADVDATSLRVNLTVSHGLLTLASTNGITVFSGANNSASMTIDGTIANLNTAIAGLKYTPAVNYNGSDLLTVLTSDLGAAGSGGTKTDSDTVAISVDAVNDAPINSVPGAQTANEDLTLGISGITVADMDATSLQVNLSVSHGILTLSSTSGLTVTGDGSDSLMLSGPIADLNSALGGLSYTPAGNYNLDDLLTVLTSDLGATGSGGTLTDSDTVAIAIDPVNDAPTIAAPHDQSTDEGAALTFSGEEKFILNDVDDGDDSISGNEVLHLTLSVSHGTLTLPEGEYTLDKSSSGDGTAALDLTGSIADLNIAMEGLVYQPSAHFNGDDTLTYVLDDDGYTGSGTPEYPSGSLTIAVRAVNNSPTITLPDPQNTNEDTALVLSSLDDTAISVADVDDADAADDEVMQVTLSVNDGALDLASTSGLTFDEENPLIFSGAIADLNAALDGLTFTPAKNFNGTSTLHVVVSDLGYTDPAYAGGEGIALVATANLAISVTAVNDAPEASLPGSVSEVNEDLSTSLTEDLGQRRGRRQRRHGIRPFGYPRQAHAQRRRQSHLHRPIHQRLSRPALYRLAQRVQHCHERPGVPFRSGLLRTRDAQPGR